MIQPKFNSKTKLSNQTHAQWTTTYLIFGKVHVIRRFVLNIVLLLLFPAENAWVGEKLFCSKVLKSLATILHIRVYWSFLNRQPRTNVVWSVFSVFTCSGEGTTGWMMVKFLNLRSCCTLILSLSGPIILEKIEDGSFKTSSEHVKATHVLPIFFHHFPVPRVARKGSCAPPSHRHGARRWLTSLWCFQRGGGCWKCYTKHWILMDFDEERYILSENQVDLTHAFEGILMNESKDVNEKPGLAEWVWSKSYDRRS